MPNPSPKWKDNEGFQDSMKPPIEPDKGPLVRSPICFKAWQDLHDALGKVPNKQQWIRDKLYAAAESEGLLGMRLHSMFVMRWRCSHAGRTHGHPLRRALDSRLLKSKGGGDRMTETGDRHGYLCRRLGRQGVAIAIQPHLSPFSLAHSNSRPPGFNRYACGSALAYSEGFGAVRLYFGNLFDPVEGEELDVHELLKKLSQSGPEHGLDSGI